MFGGFQYTVEAVPHISSNKDLNHQNNFRNAKVRIKSCRGPKGVLSNFTDRLGPVAVNSPLEIQHEDKSSTPMTRTN